MISLHKVLLTLIIKDVWRVRSASEEQLMSASEDLFCHLHMILELRLQNAVYRSEKLMSGKKTIFPLEMVMINRSHIL